jgi:hypothetical protein
VSEGVSEGEKGEETLGGVTEGKVKGAADGV